jgi:hypothetical protein
MAIAIRPEYQERPERDELVRLVDGIESLLADYLRHSMLRRETNVPLSTLMRDLRALLDSAGR